MDRSAQEKLNQIQSLLKAKAEIESKLEQLLSPEKQVILPPDFNMNNIILDIVKQAGEVGIPTLKVLSIMKEKYPQYGLTRRKVAGSLAYLKKYKKTVVLIGRGVYKAVDLP